MGRAYVVELRDKVATLRDENGHEAQYDQAEGVESPPVIHADFLWPKGAEKREVRFDGDVLPDAIVLRDGGFPLDHRYQQRKSSTRC